MSKHKCQSTEGQCQNINTFKPTEICTILYINILPAEGGRSIGKSENKYANVY